MWVRDYIDTFCVHTIQPCTRASQQAHRHYGVAMISRLLKIISLFCRMSSLWKGSFAKETYHHTGAIAPVSICGIKTIRPYKSIIVFRPRILRLSSWLSELCGHILCTRNSSVCTCMTAGPSEYRSFAHISIVKESHTHTHIRIHTYTYARGDAGASSYLRDTETL